MRDQPITVGGTWKGSVLVEISFDELFMNFVIGQHKRLHTLDIE